MLLLAVYLVGLILGGIFAWILGLFGISGWLGLFLSGFLAFVVTGFLRPRIAGYFADKEGVSGPAPYAFSAAMRYTIGAVIAAILAYLLSLNNGALGIGMMTGALMGLLTVMISGLVFSMKLLSGK